MKEKNISRNLSSSFKGSLFPKAATLQLIILDEFRHFFMMPPFCLVFSIESGK